MSRAYGQRRGLGRGLRRLDPHHLTAGNHHLACAGVAEVEHRLDHASFARGHDTGELGHVDHLTQLDLGGERSVAKALSGGDRVTESDQQPGQRGEQHPDDLQDSRGVHRERVGVLTAEGAWAHSDHHVADHCHHADGHHDTPGGTEHLDGVSGGENRCGSFADDAQQYGQRNVFGPIGEHVAESASARTAVFDQILDPRGRHRHECVVDGREDAADRYQRNCGDQRGYISGHW